jgi:4-amino-4-deoxy-L-arabinose transferase-like glycosyltransferase
MMLSDKNRRWLPVCVAMCVGLAYRLWLMSTYAGWEESDYGNLAMVRGVLDGGFVHFDMNHMPGYYGLAAIVLAFVGDTVVAARATSLLGGIIALGLSVHLARRLGGVKAAWLAALVLIVQPEFALYAASSLREPVYAAFVLGALAALLSEHLVLAGSLAGLAFFVRMDGALVLAPVLILHTWRGHPKRLLRTLSPLVCAIVFWAVYCRMEHGTFAFWGHSVQVNLETGLGAEATSTIEWWQAGAHVVTVLGGWLLPWRIGWGIWLGCFVFAFGVLRRSSGPQQTLAVAALSSVGVWLGMGLVGQHSPTHNLYWKWLCPVVPMLVPVGVVGLLTIADRLSKHLGSLGAKVLIGVVILQGLLSNAQETQRQLLLSESLYRPQLELAQWIESEIPDDVPLLLDNIPACWIRRQATNRKMISWFDVPTNDALGFSRWVEREKIGLILWFRESWTQAPVVAPFLSAGGEWRGGGVTLIEVDREDDYGWILFRVEGDAKP